MIKTTTTIEGVNAINFGNTADRYYWCKNIGETTLYVSAKEDISPDTDDVAMLEPGDIVMIETYNQDIYVLGAGKIQIYESETNDCPFKIGGKGGESPDLSLYAKTADVPNIKVNAAVDADTVGGKSASNFYSVDNPPIKSTSVSGTTNGNGDVYLWGVDTGNTPISACGSPDTVFSPFLNGDSSIYMLHAISVYTDSPVASTAVTATVYYF